MSGTGTTHTNRHGGHRWMGPPESCDRCYGRGHYPECDDNGDEIGDRFCDCPCGDLRWAGDQMPPLSGDALVEAAKIRAAERAAKEPK